jgi:hypothetical protein
MPLTQYRSIYHIDHLIGSGWTQEVGILLQDTILAGLALPQQYCHLIRSDVEQDVSAGSVQYYPASSAFYGLFDANQLNDAVQVFSSLPKDAKLTGQVITQPVTCHRLRGGTLSYWELWLDCI